MASTYSNLKFELIGTGEQVGTWGNTTNTNLGTAIEQAIVGTASVSFSSADVTLTLTNTNAAQDARALRLNLTGTSGGARNLVLGSGCQIDKPYIINNGLADTVTVKNTTGTGIAVPAGKTMWVYNNGTNVVDAVTHLSSLTLGSALPIASGGTGSTSTTFVNLATNVTGTLPIANGGTGSTSTTFVNLTTNVTGTLPIANGGTGATTLTANNVILGNGTSAPLFVAPGSSGNVLTSNGTTWTSAAVGGGFDSGTVMLFAQTTAPTGWTKDTTNYNNSGLRIVTGTASTGGSVDFTTAFASQTPSGTVSVSGSAGNTTLSTPVIPSHTHPAANAGGAFGNPLAPRFVGSPNTYTAPSPAFPGWITGSTGGGGAHSHPLSISSATFSGNAINLAVKYVDVIRATKN